MKPIIFVKFFILVFFCHTLFANAYASEVKVISNVKYGPNQYQEFDVYIPKKSKSKKVLPAIVMVHGGGWTDGDKANKVVFQNKVNHWLPKGFVFVSVNYRISNSPNPQLQQSDVGAALEFIQKNSGSYSIDRSQMVLMGHSAGGHLVALFMANQSNLSLKQISGIKGVIIIDSGAMNVVESMNDNPPSKLRKVFGSDPEFWKLNSPFHQLKSKVPPFLFVCGSSRQKVCSSKESLRQKMIGFGGEAQIERFPLSHRELNEGLGRHPRYTKLVDDFIARVLQ